MSTIQQNDSLFINISTKCGVLILEDDTGAGLSILSIVLLCNFVVGLPANTWVVWLICHRSKEQLASEIYLLSLAACEILYCLGLPAQLYSMYSCADLSFSFAYLLLIQWYLVWIARPIFQSCVCTERYMAVVHPLTFIRLKPLKYKVIQCAAAWCFLFLTIYLLRELPAETNAPLIWFIPNLCMLVYCYFSIMWSLKRPGPGQREKGKEGERRRKGDKIKRNAFNVVLVHLACFLFNYLPALIVQHVRRHILIPGILLDFIMSMGIVCGLIQPLIYLHRAGKLSFIQRTDP